MAQAATVRLHGLREVNRAFNRIDKEVVGEIKAELKKVAEPVAADARGRIGRYRGASTSTIKPYATMKGVVVRQQARKRTGRHAQVGSLQMGHLIGALEDHEDEIREDVEDLLDWLARKEGF